MNPLYQLLAQVARPDFGNLINAPPDGYRVLGWIVLLPLIGAIINGTIGRRLGRDAVYITGVAATGGSFLLALFAYAALLKANGSAEHAAAGAEHAAEAGEHAARAIASISYNAGEWFRGPAGNSAAGAMIKFRYVLDNLSGVMLLVVTGVGLLIHVYSTGYMSHDKGYAKFFAFLNLFMFSMLNLILADSIVLLFVGWEGVGLCSYLLIGFWFTNSQYASAGRKAFIVNRIGDVGVILGIAILAWKLGAYSFEAMRAPMALEHSPALSALSERPDLADFLSHTLSFGSTWIHDRIYDLFTINQNGTRVPMFSWGGLACFLLFIGCTGKSAQIPLYVWLPDAMAGPTPVSALIHAATMVTAGVYLLCRLSFVYVHFPSVMAVIAVIGALTALLAATIALAQVELKKVLAYSTVSQLGFMFMGCGVGAFSAGLFHVYTHAMFKACLFLGAGAVMHACRDKQDLRELGGLKKYLPWTYGTFAVATLAIIGTPGLSGFFSKDEILFRALASHNSNHPWVPGFVFAVGVIAATLTAFYMCRLLFLTFWGEFKGWSLDPDDYKKGTAPVAAHATPTAAMEREPEPANAPGKVVTAADKHGHSVGGHSAAAADPHHDDHGHDDHGHGHHEGNPWDPPKDNPWNMTGVLAVLAFLSIVAGYIGLPFLFTHKESVIGHWLAPVVSEWHIDHAAARSKEIMAMGLGVAAFLAGSGAAYFVYVMQGGRPAQTAAVKLRPLYNLVYDKWRVDELYDLVVVRPLRGVSNFAANIFDRWFIDGIVRLVGLIPRGFGAVLRKVQTGNIQVYGAVLALGMAALLGWAVLRPSATIAYRVEPGNRVSVQAYGGPGYAYRWDMDGPDERGALQFPQEFTDQSAQQTTCTPRDNNDGRRVCQIAVEVRNAFGRTARVTRTIEIPSESAEERR